ncbi:hypothetical protein Barb6XT_00213 [Bacteroidales bacterium Barb6XT]|nr:hypothetical protein Barb6XT_00213 [Bacteroidales bacterium Barb6XT]
MEHLTGIEREKEETVHTAHGLRLAWYKLRQRLEDWSDLLYCWIHRNDKKISLEEFNKYIDDRLTKDV